MPFDINMPLNEYPGLSCAERIRLKEAGLSTLKDLEALVSEGDGRTDEILAILGSSGKKPETLRREIGIATGKLFAISKPIETELARHRVRIIDMGPSPSAGDIAAATTKLAGNIGKLSVSDKHTAPVLALDGQKIIELGNAAMAKGNLEEAINYALEATPYLLDDRIVSALPLDGNLYVTVKQAAIALEQVQFNYLNNLYYSLDSSLDALEVGQKALALIISSLQPMPDFLKALLMSYYILLLAIWGKLAELLKWLKSKGSELAKKIWKIFKKLIILWEFFLFMKKFEGDVVYCYTFCANWKEHGIDAEGNDTTVHPYTDFWDCVKRCLDSRGVTMSDALWEALKMLGVELFLKAIDP